MRLNASQYRNVAAALLGGRPGPGRRLSPPGDLVLPLGTPNSNDRFSTFAASYAMTDLDFRQVLDSAADLSTRLVRTLKNDRSSCLGAAMKPPFAECARSLIRQKGELLFNRPLTAAEVTQYETAANESRAQLGDDEALGAVFQAMLMAPQFIFRPEIGGPTDGSGVSTLTPFEVAAAISHALTDGPPDEPLWQAAVAGALETPQQIQAHVARLLALLGDSEPARRFLKEYFQYARVRNIFKDPAHFPFHSSEKLEQEADLFVKDALASAGHTGLLKALLTSNTVFVRKDTAPSYDLTDVTSVEPERRALPAGPRLGILGHPAFLSAWSEPERTDPVRRGKFVSESLLCRKVPSLPIGQVPPLPDLGPDATMRQRLEVHSKGDCWECHKYMDPIGLGLEQFDHVGRLRAMEGNAPVDSSGELTDAGETNGPFVGVAELSMKLAESSVVEQCFVRHSFRFWAGRFEEGGDSCALKAAHDAYRETGDYAALVADFFTSKSFFKRSVRQ